MQLIVLLGGGVLVGVGTVFAMNAWDRRVAERASRADHRVDLAEVRAAPHAEDAPDPVTTTVAGHEPSSGDHPTP